MSAEQAVYRHLREFAEHFTPPAPFSSRVEISDGQVVMMMSPRPRHRLTAKLISRQLDQQLRSDLLAVEATETEDGSLGKLRIPDILVVPRNALDSDDPLDPHDVLLAVEIVSPSNPDNDYKAKKRDYPAMGIPHYLIVDPREGTAHHYWAIVITPDGPVYEACVPFVFGDTITIGDWSLDTTELPRYSAHDMT